jgi:inward rectifier potassium channel
MAHKTNKTGFGEKYTTYTKRIINKDGSFNVIKEGGTKPSLYQHLLQISWAKFSLYVFAFYLIFNSLFALFYLLAGAEHLQGIHQGNTFDLFLEAFFFSVQTFTTVGYGAISPVGTLTNLIATVEAMIGLLGFALATGLLYGRFSKPTHSLQFSQKALFFANDEGQRELHFQVANRKEHVLMEMEARVLLKLNRRVEGEVFREFYELKLKVDRILFFPLNWRLVHLVDPESPLYDLSPEKANALEVELLVLIKGFDSTFNQIVHARHSYTAKEIVSNQKFTKAYTTNTAGDTVMQLRDLDSTQGI